MKKTKNMSMLIALLLVLMAGSVGVQADGSDPLDPSDGGADWDGDGLTNAEEQAAGTDMNNADTDNDGIPDGWEVAYGLNPLSASDANADPDGDGLTNTQEYNSGTNPNRSREYYYFEISKCYNNKRKRSEPKKYSRSV